MRNDILPFDQKKKPGLSRRGFGSRSGRALLAPLLWRLSTLWLRPTS